ncbi:chemotaxis protein CheA [Cohnella sp. LGH]|uniref:chemotaxis protein CheA n=1 Tax=Cohnella sp. LGH TaxID=1619153 RepID=UPI001ADB550C|nr:chemotaxis protein CheA [Cohnella sp. LGH]QTH43666.1 chemotaxis protein CheA [Cohnella sp. LGH]
MSDSLEPKAKGQSVRVDVSKLEQMMNMVGELIIDQTRLRLLEKQIRREDETTQGAEELRHVVDRLSIGIGDLQQSVMKIRMLPVDQLFNRIPRMVRDLSKSGGKEIELIMEGSETELDRTLIEGLLDPLVLLVRHALDHGIESPEERMAAGKPVKGTLRLSARRENNQALVIIEDDGAGIDTDMLKRRIAHEGKPGSEMVTTLNDQEIAELIFHPVLSASLAKEFELSAVKAEIEKIRGRIHIQTRKGNGTRIEMHLPLTLSIIQGLQVAIADRSYIVPMNGVVEIVRTTADQIKNVQGRPVMVLRNRILPILWLRDYFRLPRGNEFGSSVSLLVVGHQEERVAIAVDKLIGVQDVVVKSLGALLGQVEGVSGATTLGSGKVAPILDMEAVSAKLRSQIPRGPIKTDRLSASQESCQETYNYEVNGHEMVL